VQTLAIERNTVVTLSENICEKIQHIDLTDLGSFDVILADPPWTYNDPEAIHLSEMYKVEEAKINYHYNTLSLDEIKNIKIPASKDSILFLWATAPLLPEAIETLKAWGYEYKTNAIWHKISGHNGKVPIINNLGFYFKNRHELLLVGKRGNIKCPNPNSRYYSIFDGKSNAHSQKPDVVYSIIEDMYPGKSKIELFARRRREGWTAWGNQLDTQIQTTIKKLLIEG
jgi:N6-adenosine-specific RNA methylase IME4